MALVNVRLFARRGRTLLAILGVAVSGAMLLDMVMLSSGMRESFRRLLVARGFQIRLTPKGTLPFDTDATISDASSIERTLATNPDVIAVSPVLGGQLFLSHGTAERAPVATAVLGTRAAVQAEYDVIQGREPTAANEVVASDDILRALGATIGDTLRAAAGYDPELRALVGTRPLVVVGRAHFLFTPAGERVAALPIETLQEMGGASQRDRASILMVRLRDQANVDSVRGWIENANPRVTATSIADAIQQVDQRLSYFRQLALILGAVSLVVGFLLVTTIVTVSVNERIGEIAVLRAIGVTRSRIVLRIGAEGVVIMTLGALAGLALGLVTARYLNSILAGFPGLPEAIDFFLFEPHDAWRALGMLVGAGVLAGIYPAWRGASLPIAATLREEAVG